MLAPTSSHPASRLPEADPCPSFSLILCLGDGAQPVAPLFDRLDPVLRSLGAAEDFQIVLIDDGIGGALEASRAELMRRHGERVTVIGHVQRRGLGAAMATGFQAARGELICTMNADCAFFPEALPGMIEHLRTTDADIVVAAISGCGDPRGPRRWLTRALGSLTGRRLRSFTGFCRLYRADWAHPGLFSSQGELAAIEILTEAARRGARISEYAIDGDAVRAPSKGLGWIDGARILGRVLLANFRNGAPAESNPVAPGPRVVRAPSRAAAPSPPQESRLLDQWILVDRVTGDPSATRASSNGAR